MSRKLVLCPLEIESRFLLDAFRKLNLQIESTNVGKMRCHFIPTLDLQVAVGGHGKVQFAVQTQYLLSLITNLDAVFCVGAAGGLMENLNIGDIVIGEKTIEHDYKEKFDKKAKIPELPGDSKLLAKAKSISYPSFKIHYGAIASGDEDIIDPLRAAELLKNTDAFAVAWEGIGGAKACKFNGVPYLEIRAITDNARNLVSESFVKNLPLAMGNAALVISKLG